MFSNPKPAITLAALLLLTACSGGDKAVVDEITVDAASLDLSGADEKMLGAHFAVAPRAGSESDTLRALTLLELDGADVSGERVIDGSTVTYTDWRAQDGSSEVTAERVVLSGLHIVTGEDGEPAATFDALQADDLRAVDFEETTDADGNAQRRQTVEAGLSELVLVSPTPELALDISRLLRGADEAQDETVGELTRDLDFRAMRLADFTADVSDTDIDGKMSVAQVVVGNDADAGTLDLVVESVDFDWTVKNSPAPGSGSASMKMDGMTALGLNTDTVEEAQGGMGGLAGLISPGSEPPYRSIDFGAMRYLSDQFDLDFAGFEADSEASSRGLTMRSVLQPMELSVKDATGTPLAPYLEVLRENGMDSFTLKGSATTEIDRRADRISYSDAMFELDEGLRADCDYALTGTLAAAKALEESGVTEPDFSTAQSNEDISRLIEQMEAYQAAQAEANANIRIEGGTCVIQDVAENSFVTRAYAVASGITGRPVPVLKASAQGLVAMTSLAAPDPFQRGLADSVGSALIDFIGEPGQTLTLTLDPAEPVPLGALQGDGSVEFEAMGISAKVE